MTDSMLSYACVIVTLASHLSRNKQLVQLSMLLHLLVTKSSNIFHKTHSIPDFLLVMLLCLLLSIVFINQHSLDLIILPSLYPFIHLSFYASIYLFYPHIHLSTCIHSFMCFTGGSLSD